MIHSVQCNNFKLYKTPCKTKHESVKPLHWKSGNEET